MRRILFLFLLIAIISVGTISAQIEEKKKWHIGDIYTFKDGSKGVVCYVNPKNAKKGWVVAPKDVNNGQKYALWTGSKPAGLKDASTGAFNNYVPWVNIIHVSCVNLEDHLLPML